MSKGRKVPPPAAPPTLPPPVLQAAIADAVHQVVVEFSAKTLYPDGSGSCGWYSVVGSHVCMELLGRPYAINVGSFRLQTSEADGGVGFAFDAERPLIEDQEFHAVMIARHPSGRFEVADLASRHWRTWATRLGAPWDAPDPPKYLWCFGDELHRQWPLGISYVANEALTQRHIRRFQTNPGLAAALRKLTDLALGAIGEAALESYELATIIADLSRRRP
jgi:hypothetical protein